MNKTLSGGRKNKKGEQKNFFDEYECVDGTLCFAMISSNVTDYSLE